MAEHQPLVSVIMPCYNMERFIADTINSVIHQTFTDWELLITDDASTDKTVAIVQSMTEQDARIRLTVNTTHLGIAASRNNCIKASHGRFLAFLDADDLWHPDKLQRQLQFMMERKIGFSYSSYDLVDESGTPMKKIIHTAGDLDYNAYLRNTIIGCSTVMIDIDLVGQVIVPDFRTSEDSATWLNILKRGFKAYAINEALTSYRIRSHSASSNKFKAAADLWKVYRKNEQLSFLKTFYYFCCYTFNAIKKRL